MVLQVYIFSENSLSIQWEQKTPRFDMWHLQTARRINSKYGIWGSHISVYEELYHLGYSAVQSVENQPTFRRNMSPPSSGSNEQSEKQACNWVANRSQRSTCLILVSRLAYSPILMLEAIYSSETSVDFQRTTHRYIPDDGTLHNNACLRNQVSVSHEAMCMGTTSGCIIHTTSQLFCNNCDSKSLEYQIWMMLLFHTFPSETLPSVFQ
jgi:hypothetical protein